MPRSKPPRRPRHKGPTPPRTSAPGSDIPPEIAQLIAGTSPADLQQLFGGLMDVITLPAARAGPSRRRPRRNDVVTYRIRVDLDDAEPPIWRDLDVGSDLTLDRLHVHLADDDGVDRFAPA